MTVSDYGYCQTDHVYSSGIIHKESAIVHSVNKKSNLCFHPKRDLYDSFLGKMNNNGAGSQIDITNICVFIFNFEIKL